MRSQKRSSIVVTKIMKLPSRDGKVSHRAVGIGRPTNNSLELLYSLTPHTSLHYKHLSFLCSALQDSAILQVPTTGSE